MVGDRFSWIFLERRKSLVIPSDTISERFSIFTVTAVQLFELFQELRPIDIFRFVGEALKLA